MPTITFPQETLLPGATINIRLDKINYGDDVNGWKVADYLLLRFEQDVTVAGAVVEGEDTWRILNRIRMKDASGTEFMNLTGPQLRAVIYQLQGQRVEDEPADLAIGADRLLDVTFVIPLTIRADYLERQRDTGIPIAAWRNGGDEIQLQVAALADFTEGATSVSAFGAGNKRLTASIIYHVESKPEFKTRMVWKETPPQNDLEFTVPTRGLLMAMFLHKTGANGGASVTGITDVSSEHYQLDNIARVTQKTIYLRSREVDSDDPIKNDKAFPLVFAEPGQKLSELRVFPGEPVHFKLTGTYTNYKIVYCVLEERPEQTAQIQAARQGVTHTKPALAEKSATKDKDDLGPLRRIFPLKAATADEIEEMRQTKVVHEQRRRVIVRDHSPSRAQELAAQKLAQMQRGGALAGIFGRGRR